VGESLGETGALAIVVGEVAAEDAATAVGFDAGFSEVGAVGGVAELGAAADGVAAGAPAQPTMRISVGMAIHAIRMVSMVGTRR
jgi:hypothetical protein